MIIFDIDGTLADNTHRIHHITHPDRDKRDYDTYESLVHLDSPIMPLCDIMYDIWHGMENVIFVTARREENREATRKWLRARIGIEVPNYRLYMRPAGDKRADYEVKSDLLDKVIADGYKPTLVFEDRKRCADMWRKRGLICAHVAEGDF